MSSQIKARILKVTYNKENNLFQLTLEDMANNKQTGIAVKGSDWGVTPDVPEDIISQFCTDMVGKEKSIQITVDDSSLMSADKDDKGLATQDEIDRVSGSMDDFPIDEIMNVLHEEENDED